MQSSSLEITSKNSPVHDEAPKEIETQKNNSIIDLGKLLSGEKSRLSLTDKEIYDYLKNHHVLMKGDYSLQKNCNKKEFIFLSLLRWNGWKNTGLQLGTWGKFMQVLCLAP